MASRTFAQLKTAVQDEGYGTDTAAQQGNFLNAEYQRLAGKRRWKWLEAIDSSTSTVVGTAGYAPPTGCRSVDAVRMHDPNGIAYQLEPMEEQQLLARLSADPATGTPRYWTQYAGQIYLYPTPSAVYSLTVYYVKNITPMVADGDTHLVPEAYDSTLVWGAVMRMAIRQRDWLTRAFAQQERDAVEMAMAAEYQMTQRQQSDRVEDVTEGWGVW